MSGMTKAERLIEMKRLYIQRAFSDIEMADRLGTRRETVFRDRKELETVYPFIQDDSGRWKIDRNRFISEIKVNLHEALTLYLAARKTSRQTRYYHPHAASAVEKLAGALRQPMTGKLLKAADTVLKQEKDPEKIKIIETLAQAWVEQKKVRIRYQRLGSESYVNHTISPYLIEPSIWSDSLYAIALSDVTETLIAFRVDRIESAFLSSEGFEIPADFDEQELLKHAWGIWYGDKEPVTVKLRFSKDVTRRVKESTWHPLERVEDIEDGGCLWSAEVAEWREMLPWIRGWGADVEVLGPESLRKTLENEASRLADLYGVAKMEKQLIAHLRKKDRKIQTLDEHLMQVSKLTGEFAAKLGLKECGEIIGLLHDVGKASQEFQNYIGSAEGLVLPDALEWVDHQAKKGKVDHSTAGAQVIYKKLENNGSKAAQALSLCIASHHSGLIDSLTPKGENNFQRRIEKPEEQTHADESWIRLPRALKQLDRLLTYDIENQIITKLNSLKLLPESHDTLNFKRGLLLRYLLSCLIDADRLDTADFEFPSNERIRNYGNYRSWKALIERLDGKISEFENKDNKNEVDELRNKVSQACLNFSIEPKGIYQLTVPTGGGKTFSSLRFALNHAKHHGMDRVFYIIPYTSIIDQNADEVRKILEDKDKNGQYLNKVVLEHHSNIVSDDKNGEKGWLSNKRRNLLSENWDAPIVFTTQVQFLEALFGSGTRGVRRMHQLANSVIIFDEVQTIPIRAVQMFNAALEFLAHGSGSSVVLCTATQPLLDKVEPIEHALKIDGKIIENENTLYEMLRRIEVIDKRKDSAARWRDEEIAQLAQEELGRKGSVLIIVNTKNSAKSLYQTIAVDSSTSVYHLSTRMCPVHRLEVLNEIKGKLVKKQPVICVSTQLIEAGVDIDFGSVIRYLAGLDSITQAAGRCNRSGKQEDENGKKVFGNVYIVNPENERIDRLKDIKDGIKITGRVLREFQKDPDEFDNDRLGLKAMERYYEYYFYGRKDEMAYNVGANSSIGRNDTLFNLLSRNKIAANRHGKDSGFVPFFSQAFQTAAREFEAIDSPTRGVIVRYGEEGSEIVNDLCGTSELEKQYELIKRAQRYSVNLFPHEFQKLMDTNAIREVQKDAGIYCLDSQFYSNQFGWSDEIVSPMKTLIE